mgnify:CR=1 FL=1
MEPDGPASLIVFDCDGTLVDSQHAIHESARRSGRDVLGVEPTREAVLALVGLPLRTVLDRLHPGLEPERLDQLVESYKDHYAALRAEPDREPPLYPGTRAVLERLLSRGHSMGVATGKSRRGLEHTLDVHDLRGFFVTTWTGDDAPGKPHPGMLEGALREAGHEPDEALMVGDTTFDLEMARNARVPAVGVSWGYHDRTLLEDLQPLAVIDSWAELDPVIFRLRDGY